MSEQPDTKTDRLMSIAELADYLNVKVSRIYGWRKRKVGPPSDDGSSVRIIRYKQSEVDRWLKNRDQ